MNYIFLKENDFKSEEDKSFYEQLNNYLKYEYYSSVTLTKYIFVNYKEKSTTKYTNFKCLC